MEGPLDIDIEGIMVNDLDVDGLSDGISLSQGDKLTMNLSYHGKELNECSYVMGDFILTYDIDNTEKQSTAVVTGRQQTSHSTSGGRPDRGEQGFQRI